MGKLWWQSGGVADEDLEKGRYLSWEKSIIEKDKKSLSEKLKNKNPTKNDLKSINSTRWMIKYMSKSLATEKIKRSSDGNKYTKLFNKVCTR